MRSQIQPSELQQQGGGIAAAAVTPSSQQTVLRNVTVPDPKLSSSSTDISNIYQNKPIDIIRDRDEFRRKARECLALLHDKLLPMEALNDTFILSLLDDSSLLEVKLRPDLGKFTLAMNDEGCVLDLTSPKSGGFEYVFCTNTESWRGKNDGHDLNGMIVRDFIQLCHGVPDL